MGVIVTVTVGVVTPMVVRVGVAGGVGMGVHRYQLYSTSLPSPVHLQVSSCYWKL
jgi:hypothetical protein